MTAGSAASRPGAARGRERPFSSTCLPVQHWSVQQTHHVSLAALKAERSQFGDEDVHFPESLVREVVEEFSQVGDRVLDPFAGFGTTLVVSERMGRKAIGLELLPERVAAIRARLGESATVICGDARRVLELVHGQVDLCLTSPPYMNAVDHPQNPLTGYRTLDGDYQVFLSSLTDVFAGVLTLLRPGGHLVINAANIRTGDVVTPLAWDIKRAVAAHADFLSQSTLEWDEPPDWLSEDYCMVFAKPS